MKVDIGTAKTIRTQPVHQWDTMVSLEFPATVDSDHYKLHIDQPDGTGEILDIGLHTAILPNTYFGETFDGDVVCHLVKNDSLKSETICDIIIPVIPRQKGETPR